MPPPERWRVGIVGCGRIAGGQDRPDQAEPTTHAGAFARDPRFELRACACPSAEDRAAFQRVWRVPAGYESLAALLQAEALDVISLCTPMARHAEQAIQILSAPRPPKLLWLEKPACETPVQLATVTAAAAASSVRIVVNHTRRFDPAHQALATLVRSGRLGPVLGGRAVSYGGWLQNGCHLLDTLRLLSPAPIAVREARWCAHGRGSDRDLEARLLVGEAPLTVEAVDEADRQAFELELRCAAGRVQLLEFGRLLHAEMIAGASQPIVVPGYPARGLALAFTRALDVLAEELDGRDAAARLGVDPASAAETMRLVWQAGALADAHPVEISHA